MCGRVLQPTAQRFMEPASHPRPGPTRSPRAGAQEIGQCDRAQEIGQGDRERTRALFEHATHSALPAKRMKFLFRRYLDYEKAHGDAAGVERVRGAPRAYDESNLAA